MRAGLTKSVQKDSARRWDEAERKRRAMVEELSLKTSQLAEGKQDGSLSAEEAATLENIIAELQTELSWLEKELARIAKQQIRGPIDPLIPRVLSFFLISLEFMFLTQLPPLAGSTKNAANQSRLDLSPLSLLYSSDLSDEIPGRAPAMALNPSRRSFLYSGLLISRLSPPARPLQASV